MPKSKSKRKKVLAAERAHRSRQQSVALMSRQSLLEIERLVNLPPTELVDWPEDLQPVLQHACQEFSDCQPIIHRDVDGRPVIIAANPQDPGWVVLDDIHNGEWRLRMFATGVDFTGVPA